MCSAKWRGCVGLEYPNSKIAYRVISYSIRIAFVLLRNLQVSWHKEPAEAPRERWFLHNFNKLPEWGHSYRLDFVFIKCAQNFAYTVRFVIGGNPNPHWFLANSKHPRRHRRKRGCSIGGVQQKKYWVLKKNIESWGYDWKQWMKLLKYGNLSDIVRFV